MHLGFRNTEWRPGSRRSEDVANLRVCRALVRIYCSVHVGDSDHADVARTLWPVLRRQRASLLQAMAATPPTGRRHRRASSNEADDVSEWIASHRMSRCALPVVPPANNVLEAIGQAIVEGSSTYRQILQELQADLDALVAASRMPHDTNLELLCNLLQLAPAERDFLALAAAVHASTIGSAPFTSVSGHARLLRGLQAALGGLGEQEVRTMVRRGSPLLRSGLLDPKTFLQPCDLEDLLRLSRMGMRLLASRANSLEAMAALVLQQMHSSQGGQLQWPHLEDRTRMLQPLLAQALAARESGVNILLYGGPGTGKTQFAARLIERTGALGFSVRDMDADGDPASREERLASLLLTQVFAPVGRSIVVLDEAEDIFQGEYNNPFGRMFGHKDESKCWVNNLLESNARPVIWISNRIDHLDPAYVRRFTYCLEFPSTPRRVREAVARAHLEPVGCSSALVDVVAAQTKVSPAMVASAARFTRLAQLQRSQADDGVRIMLGDMLKALGSRIQASVPERSTRFDLRYLNTSGLVTPEAVIGGLERTGRGRLLLSGPPGTGKTQLAAEVARRLGRELVYRTASDINSMWFGESERNVARMFEECDADGEVLFLDEADTLLGAREGSGHRAEVAVTSEFLRQVEAFRGVFVCATNFRGHLDAALLRRFEYRLELQTLAIAQRRALFCETALGWDGADTAALPSLDAQVVARLDRLERLTPGDFANVVRRVRSLQLQPDSAGWLDELEAEHSTKPGAARGGIGFL